MFHPFLLNQLIRPTSVFTDLHQVAHSQFAQAHEAHLERSTDGYTLKIKLPDLIGRQLEDIKLTVEDDLLTLMTPALSFAQQEGLKPILEEIPTAEYRQKYRLPREIDLDRIEASLKDEELLIQLPRLEPTRKAIEIKIG
jgi:HSP20 family molecular chaperone IbpA